MKSSGILSIIDNKSACHPQKREKLKALSNGHSNISLTWTQNCRDLMQAYLATLNLLQSSIIHCYI